MSLFTAIQCQQLCSSDKFSHDLGFNQRFSPHIVLTKHIHITLRGYVDQRLALLPFHSNCYQYHIAVNNNNLFNQQVNSPLYVLSPSRTCQINALVLWYVSCVCLSPRSISHSLHCFHLWDNGNVKACI